MLSYTSYRTPSVNATVVDVQGSGSRLSGKMITR